MVSLEKKLMNYIISVSFTNLDLRAIIMQVQGLVGQTEEGIWPEAQLYLYRI